MKFKSTFSHKIIPVLVLDDSSKAREVGLALVECGLPIVEVTLRTESAWKSIEIFKEIPELSVGVGSVTSREQLVQAAQMKLDFAVSPGFEAGLVEKALELDIAYLPGVSNPSDMMRGISFGLTHLKFFPAETLGGVKAIQAMSAPFPGLTFIPTGGITEALAPAYLAESNIPAVGGSWMVSKKRINARDFAGLRSDIKSAVTAVKEGQS
jgi:2-dehydro-3-deoxyphosphogluconate aldolase/(4S)-4-hydroxy-2-oxoglutarate aldolase